MRKVIHKWVKYNRQGAYDAHLCGSYGLIDGFECCRKTNKKVTCKNCLRMMKK